MNDYEFKCYLKILYLYLSGHDYLKPIVNNLYSKFCFELIKRTSVK